MRDILFAKDLATADEGDAEGFNLKPIRWLLGAHDALGCDSLVAIGALWVTWLVFHAMAQELREV